MLDSACKRFFFLKKKFFKFFGILTWGDHEGLRWGKEGEGVESS